MVADSCTIVLNPNGCGHLHYSAEPQWLHYNSAEPQWLQTFACSTMLMSWRMKRGGGGAFHMYCLSTGQDSAHRTTCMGYLSGPTKLILNPVFLVFLTLRSSQHSTKPYMQCPSGHAKVELSLPYSLRDRHFHFTTGSITTAQTFSRYLLAKIHLDSESHSHTAVTQ